MEAAWEGIASHGTVRIKKGDPYASASVANRGSKSRELFIDTAENFYDLNADFGRTNVFEGVISHIHSLGKTVVNGFKKMSDIILSEFNNY